MPPPAIPASGMPASLAQATASIQRPDSAQRQAIPASASRMAAAFGSALRRSRAVIATASAGAQKPQGLAPDVLDRLAGDVEGGVLGRADVPVRRGHRRDEARRRQAAVERHQTGPAFAHRAAVPRLVEVQALAQHRQQRVADPHLRHRVFVPVDAQRQAHGRPFDRRLAHLWLTGPSPCCLTVA